MRPTHLVSSFFLSSRSAAAPNVQHVPASLFTVHCESLCSWVRADRLTHGRGVHACASLRLYALAWIRNSCSHLDSQFTPAYIAGFLCCSSENREKCAAGQRGRMRKKCMFLNINVGVYMCGCPYVCCAHLYQSIYLFHIPICTNISVEAHAIDVLC